MATPNPEVLFVFDQTSGAPYTGLATALSFTTYVDDTGSPVSPPTITKVTDGIFVFTPVFPSGHGLFYIVSTGNQVPNYLTRYIRPENDLGGILAVVQQLQKIEQGKWEIASNQLLIYDTDNTTVILRFNLFDSVGNPTMASIFKRVPA